MVTISSSDVVKKPSYITNPQDITFVEDERYLFKNKKVLSQKFYDKFLEMEKSFVG